MTSLMTCSDVSPPSADDDVLLLWRSDDDDVRLHRDWDNMAASLWHDVTRVSLLCTATADDDDDDDDDDAMWRSRLVISVRLLSMATSCCCWNTPVTSLTLHYQQDIIRQYSTRECCIKFKPNCRLTPGLQTLPFSRCITIPHLVVLPLGGSQIFKPHSTLPHGQSCSSCLSSTLCYLQRHLCKRPCITVLMWIRTHRRTGVQRGNTVVQLSVV